MAFIPVPDTILVESVWLYLGSIVENTYHFHSEVVITDVVLEEVGNIVQTWERTVMESARSNNAQMLVIRAKDMSVPDGAGVEIVPDPTIQGTVTDSPQPGNVTFAVKFTTGRTGRSFRGRVYHIGMTGNMCAGNAIAPATRAAMITKYGALIASAHTAGFPLVVVSKYHGVDGAGKPIPRAAGITTVINAASIDPNIDSQRRRLAGRGS